jgi:hypothetical protein
MASHAQSVETKEKTSMIPFEAFPKIPRLVREIVITEKIDGTNACIHVAEDGTVLAGSRSRWITPEDDNFGFARWVKANEEALRSGLGLGTHYGEWWGAGIQRRYGLTEKRFSLFNTTRWTDEARPAICHVTPEIYRGPFSQVAIDTALEVLRTKGSFASPGFTKPEGIVVFHSASGQLFKVTLEKDAEPKGNAA